jgi:hypothetical protein
MSLLNFLKLLISLWSLYGSLPVSMLSSMVLSLIFRYQQTQQVLVGKFLQQSSPGFKIAQNSAVNISVNV